MTTPGRMTRRRFLSASLLLAAPWNEGPKMSAPPTPQRVQAGLWRWVKSPGLERFELLRAPGAWHLRGTIVTWPGREPAEARYEVVCDGSWQTRRVDVSLRDATGERTLAIEADGGAWIVNGRADASLRGCLDVDLGWSPSTNTLPIRRLRLEVGGASGTLTAAWVRFPELSLQPLAQEYLRLSERVYRYASRQGAFVADLEVDGDGLVVDYEGVWRRVRPGE